MIHIKYGLLQNLEGSLCYHTVSAVLRLTEHTKTVGLCINKIVVCVLTKLCINKI